MNEGWRTLNTPAKLPSLTRRWLSQIFGFALIYLYDPQDRAYRMYRFLRRSPAGALYCAAFRPAYLYPDGSTDTALYPQWVYVNEEFIESVKKIRKEHPKVGLLRGARAKTALVELQLLKGE